MARQAKIPQLGGLMADCWLAEEHGRDMEITENPIEFGAPITDHAFVKPRELVIEFGVTNTPLTENLIFGASGTDRIERAREILFKLQDDKTFLSVQTLTGGRYERLLRFNGFRLQYYSHCQHGPNTVKAGRVALLKTCCMRQLITEIFYPFNLPFSSSPAYLLN